jgi:hypothetical protein
MAPRSESTAKGRCFEVMPPRQGVQEAIVDANRLQLANVHFLPSFAFATDFLSRYP